MTNDSTITDLPDAASDCCREIHRRACEGWGEDWADGDRTHDALALAEFALEHAAEDLDQYPEVIMALRRALYRGRGEAEKQAHLGREIITIARHGSGDYREIDAQIARHRQANG